MDRINTKVIAATRQYHMIDPGDRITVALSGGADSVALLLFLQKLKQEYALTLTAAHVNHGIREKEAGRDEAFVRELCESLSVPLTVGHFDLPAICKTTRESLETAARRVRYAFLQNCANGGKIATAHTASDNTETVLFHLARGTGIKGLCGIPPVRDNIIRPLIFLEGEEIRSYLSEIGQPFVTDSTNFSDRYSRNRIRLRVIPELNRVNSRLHENLLRCATLLREDSEYLDTLAAKALDTARRGGYVSLQDIRSLHKALLSRLVRMLVQEETGLTLDNHHTGELLNLIEAGSGRRELYAGYTVCLQKGKLYIVKAAGAETSEIQPQISWRIYDKNKVHNLLLKNTIDYDKIKGNLTQRHRKAGDVFQPPGRGITKSLKKLLNEAAVPLPERNRIPILSDDEGIVWIKGFGPSQRCAVNEATRTVLVIEDP